MMEHKTDDQSNDKEYGFLRGTGGAPTADDQEELSNRPHLLDSDVAYLHESEVIEFWKHTKDDLLNDSDVQQSSHDRDAEDFASEDEGYHTGTSEKTVNSSEDGDDESNCLDEGRISRTDSLANDDTSLLIETDLGRIECEDKGHGVPDQTMRKCGKLPSEATTRLGWVRPHSPPSSHPGTDDRLLSVAHRQEIEPSEGVTTNITSSGAQQGAAVDPIEDEGNVATDEISEAATLY